MTNVYQRRGALGVELGEDAVLRLTLDRPEKLNALNDEMVAGLIEALSAAEKDEAVRAILLAGAGEHFCAGFDFVDRNAIGEQRPRVGSIQRRLPSQAHRLIPLLLSVQVPIVCAARGWTAGIGLHLAAAADFTVAAADARFWEPFTERGFTADSGGTWLLPRRVGEVHARELLLLGRQLTGIDAAEWGLVHRAVDPSEVDYEASQLARQLATGPTVAIGLTKWLLAAGNAAPIDAHLRDEAFAMELSSRTEDFREGLAAFADRRPPHFKGR